MVVQQNQLGRAALQAAQCLANVTRLADHFKPPVLGQQRHQAASEQRVVVHHQQLDGALGGHALQPDLL